VYYNEARIIDAHTFDTVRELPNIPGSVNNCPYLNPIIGFSSYSVFLVLAGRTYPLEGAAVIFPQHAPYTDPVRVMVCGGSSPVGDAVDNCVSIEPEVETPIWTLERMASVCISVS
jgi:hypothetical protein